MPRNLTTGVFTRVSNSFSNPVYGTVIDPTDADALFNDYDGGLTFDDTEPLQLVGSTSGALTILAPDTASGTITLPAGTTDFSATGGTGQYVKQASAGAPFTVAAISASEITTGLLPLANGGTNANLTASNGGILYSTASAGAILAGTATARQMLQSGASGAPAWSTATWPATTTSNRLLYSSANNVVGEITTGANGVLASPGGVPGFTSAPSLGTAGSVAGSLGFANTTSGTVTIQAVAGALGTSVLSLPAASDTLIGKATTDTLTNKTFDTAGTGNSFSINGLAATANTGTGAVVRATSPTLVTPTLGVATATSLNGFVPASAMAQSYTAGTWTPTVSTTGTVGTPAYTTQVGFYVKIGTMVYANFSLVLSGWTGSPTGGVLIGSLPFTNSATANNFGAGTLFFYSVAGLAASNYGIFGSVQPGQTVMALLSAGNTTTTNVSPAQAGTTPSFVGYVMYRTDS